MTVPLVSRPPSNFFFEMRSRNTKPFSPYPFAGFSLQNCAPFKEPLSVGFFALSDDPLLCADPLLWSASFLSCIGASSDLCPAVPPPVARFFGGLDVGFSFAIQFVLGLALFGGWPRRGGSGSAFSFRYGSALKKLPPFFGKDVLSLVDIPVFYSYCFLFPFPHNSLRIL